MASILIHVFRTFEQESSVIRIIYLHEKYIIQVQSIIGDTLGQIGEMTVLNEVSLLYLIEQFYEYRILPDIQMEIELQSGMKILTKSFSTLSGTSDYLKTLLDIYRNIDKTQNDIIYKKVMLDTSINIMNKLPEEIKLMVYSHLN